MAINVAVDTVVIPNAGTTSAALTLPLGYRLHAIQMPAAFTGATVTFEQSTDLGATWQTVFDEGAAYSLTVTASKYHRIKQDVFSTVQILRIISASSEAAIRTITTIAGRD